MKQIISNPNYFEKIKSKMKKDGKNNLHILADFDRTLTYGKLNGKKTPSIISLLRDGNHLTKDYAEKANALFEKYHPIEIDPDVSLEEKKIAMVEWWKVHNELLIKSGLSQEDLKSIVKSRGVKFRKGVLEFLDYLNKNKIPLVIISASGAGDAIPMFFEEVGKNYPNILYVINEFNWDEKGKAISQKDKIIHAMNKDETIVKEIPEIYSKIKDRKNVILLGDSIGDIEMIKGFEFDNLIKIGFLNSDIDRFEKVYKENFDVVLEDDCDFSFVNELIRKLD